MSNRAGAKKGHELVHLDTWAEFLGSLAATLENAGISLDDATKAITEGLAEDGDG